MCKIKLILFIFNTNLFDHLLKDQYTFFNYNYFVKGSKNIIIFNTMYLKLYNIKKKYGSLITFNNTSINL